MFLSSRPKVRIDRTVGNRSVTNRVSIVGVVLLLVAIRALFTTRLEIKQGNSNVTCNHLASLLLQLNYMFVTPRLLIAMMPVGMGVFTGKNVENTLFFKSR